MVGAQRNSWASSAGARAQIRGSPHQKGIRTSAGRHPNRAQSAEGHPTRVNGGPAFAESFRVQVLPSANLAAALPRLRWIWRGHELG